MARGTPSGATIRRGQEDQGACWALLVCMPTLLCTRSQLTTELLFHSCLLGGKGTLAQCLKAASPQAGGETSSETEGLEAWIGSFPFFLCTYTVLRVVRLWTLMGHQVLASGLCLRPSHLKRIQGGTGRD